MVRCHIFDTEFVAFIDLLILAMTIKTVHDNVTFLPDMRLDVGSNLFFQTWPSFGNVSNKRLFLGGRKEGAVFALGGTGRLYRKRLIEVLRRSLPLPFTAFT